MEADYLERDTDYAQRVLCTVSRKFPCHARSKIHVCVFS